MVVNIRAIGRQPWPSNDYVYIGRRNVSWGMETSIFKNPIIKGQKCDECGLVHEEAGDTLPCYTKYLKRRLLEPAFREAVRNLHNKTLVCWCKPGPCHGDILLEAAKRLNDRRNEW